MKVLPKRERDRSFMRTNKKIYTSKVTYTYPHFHYVDIAISSRRDNKRIRMWNVQLTSKKRRGAIGTGILWKRNVLECITYWHLNLRCDFDLNQNNPKIFKKYNFKGEIFNKGLVSLNEIFATILRFLQGLFKRYNVRII